MNDAAKRWCYVVGANVIPADSRKKVPLVKWKEFQNALIPDEVFENWLANDMFKGGLAIVLGKLWHKNPELYISGIDADNDLAISEICTIGDGRTLPLQEFAKEYYIEQHLDDPTRAHFVILSTAPFPKKSSDKSILYSYKVRF
jgi:hypothetical protein